MTYSLYSQSYGASNANATVKIINSTTGDPATILATATGGVLNKLGNATLDSSGNLSVYIDTAQTWTVMINDASRPVKEPLYLQTDPDTGLQTAVTGKGAATQVVSLTTNQNASLQSLVSWDGKAQTPTNVRAYANDGAVWVTWDQLDPAYADSYTVTVIPGGASITTTSNRVAVTGLTNGLAYTASVQAVRGSSVSAAAVSAAVTPTTGPTGLSAIPGLVSWLAADKIAGPPANGANVTSWSDSSGNSFGASNSVALRPSGTQSFTPPTFLSTWANGKPAVAFSGTGQALGFPFDFTLANLGSELTIFVACETTATTNGSASSQQTLLTNIAYVASPTADDQRGFAIDTKGPGSPANYWRVRSGYTDANGTFNGLAPTVLSVVSRGDGNACALYVQGASQAVTVMPFAKTKGRIGLGASQVGGGAVSYTGRIGEVLVYNRALSQAERWAVEAYLASKYAITISQS